MRGSNFKWSMVHEIVALDIAQFYGSWTMDHGPFEISAAF